MDCASAVDVIDIPQGYYLDKHSISILKWRGCPPRLSGVKDENCGWAKVVGTSIHPTSDLMVWRNEVRSHETWNI
jgi:hypothetical protein